MSALALLPWQPSALAMALQQLRSSAALIHGDARGGQLELALGLAKAWLCEGVLPEGATTPRQHACGACTSCHLFEQGSHPDLKVIVPEVLQSSLGWDVADDTPADDAGEGKKRKPSSEIKVEAIRQVVSFSQTTMSRGQAKVVLIHPADRMNTVAANTLLKTLEEPPGHVRFVLSCGALDDLLPTLRSRCQAWRVPTPQAHEVIAWLQAQASKGLQAGKSLPPADAQLLLAAAGGSPQGALDLLALGWSAAMWQRVPTDVSRGVAGAWAQWPLPGVIDVLQKLCHDLSCMAAGGSPRYFVADALGVPAPLERLTSWDAELRKAKRHAEHPWNGPLKIESLLFQARRATYVDARAASSPRKSG